MNDRFAHFIDLAEMVTVRLRRAGSLYDNGFSRWDTDVEAVLQDATTLLSGAALVLHYEESRRCLSLIDAIWVMYDALCVDDSES